MVGEFDLESFELVFVEEAVGVLEDDEVDTETEEEEEEDEEEFVPF